MTMTASLLVSLTLGLSAAAPDPARADEPWPAAMRSPRSADLRRAPDTTPPPDIFPLLASRCRQWASEPANPWALAHGLVLDGRDFRARGGQPAANVILARYLRRAPPQPNTAPARERLFFDARTPDGTPVEPHPALQIKSLLRAGYPLSHRFDTPGGPVAVQALVDQLKHDFRPALVANPESAWTLDALALALEPGATFRNGEGATVRIDAVMRSALAALEAAQAELSAGMRAGQAQVPKRKQGIYAHPCGGLHYFQAVTGWARHPSVRKAWRKRLDAQLEVLLYRLDSEGRQYEAALATAPFAYRLPLLVQMLKFQGHLLETLGRYRDDTGWRPTRAQRQTVERARAALEHTVRRLEDAGAFEDLPTLAARQPQLALDLVGDTCHAARGEALWREAGLSVPAAPAPPR
ncbi:hypothetical protein [Corallococcus macrosporus]|uniref:Lipoprotein n=1 Tax=Myxococcus fulvus (strain ATCC BAA-855 / HW-1) TaxID=483219 RepID=F8CK30_MYXFH|nr:hypothetical protein [Corallococcus macrosporus]AEI66406.1 hypothetical protein LILAB_22555 [Corallococcus macrosporus]